MTTERLAPFQIHPPVSGFSFIAAGHIWGAAAIVHKVTARPIAFAAVPMTVADRGIVLRMLKAERTPESIYALDRLTCLHSGTPTHRIEIGYSFARNPTTIVTLFSMSIEKSKDMENKVTTVAGFRAKEYPISMRWVGVPECRQVSRSSA